MNLGRQLASFAAIGLISTIASAVLDATLREATMAEFANASPLALTAVGSAAASRRLTFGRTDRRSAAGDHLGGFVVRRSWISRGREPRPVNIAEGVLP